MGKTNESSGQTFARAARTFSPRAMLPSTRTFALKQGRSGTESTKLSTCQKSSGWDRMVSLGASTAYFTLPYSSTRKASGSSATPSTTRESARASSGTEWASSPSR